MDRPVIAIVPEGSTRQRKREAPRGRRVDPEARAAVRELLGDEPRRRDLLIEHLHRIQDRFGHLRAAHLAALAEEMKLAQAEVYEVASFYHHFDIVQGRRAPRPPALTVRVCDGLSCEMAGAQRAAGAAAGAARHRRARDRARRASAAASRRRRRWCGQNPVAHATPTAVQARGRRRARRAHEPAPYVDLRRLPRAAAATRLLRECLGRQARRRDR